MPCPVNGGYERNVRRNKFMGHFDQTTKELAVTHITIWIQ